ncbi:MAG: hypothetical protein II966_04400 [Lachnospiraceae bacterium]|nr:hypothetical protein [Lachnospiraceae bacterium]
MAADTDEHCILDEWAGIFKVSTRDELKELSRDDRFFKDAAKSMRIIAE